MIVFCTHCWAEIDSADQRCRYCGVDLSADPRSYEEKLVAALQHPLPEARVRICWLLGANKIFHAVSQLIELAEHDKDFFVQRAALEALGAMCDPSALPMLRSISRGQNHFLRLTAQRSIENIELSQGSGQ